MGGKLEALEWYEDACCEPAVYGSSDCACLCADAILMCSGVDLLRQWRRRYKTKLGWMRVIRRDGFSCLLDAIRHAAKSAGLETVPCAEARDLDLAYIETDRWSGPGIVKGGFVVLKTELGIAVEPVTKAIDVWRTPNGC